MKNYILPFNQLFHTYNNIQIIRFSLNQTDNVFS